MLRTIAALLAILGCCVGLATSAPVRAQAAMSHEPHVLAVPPSTVIPAVIAMVAEGGSFDPALIEQELAAATQELAEGRPVSTWVQADAVACGFHRHELIPKEVSDGICASGGVVNRYTVSGYPATTREDGRLRLLGSADEARFWFYVDEALPQADAASVELSNVTGAFNAVWRGHLPRMETVYAFTRPNDLLMIVYAGLWGRQPIRKVVVYTRM